MQHTVRDAEGTLAYVTATGSLFIKVSQGWKEIQVPTWMSLIYLGFVNLTLNRSVLKICNDVSTKHHFETSHTQINLRILNRVVAFHYTTTSCVTFQLQPPVARNIPKSSPHMSVEA